MPFVKHGDCRLFYIDKGTGPETILLLHSNFASSRWWEPVSRFLAGPYRLLIPDLRGHGRSCRPDDGYDIANQAGDLGTVIEAAAPETLHLVAHGFSAAVALEYAVRHPEKLCSLVLVAPAPAEGVKTPPEALALFQEMKADRGLLLQAISSIIPSRAPGATIQSLVDEAQAMAPAAFIANAQALSLWHVHDRLRMFRIPTLLIWGDADIVVSYEEVERTMLDIPGSTLEVMPGVGHAPYFETPEPFVDILLDFLLEDFDHYQELRQVEEDESAVMLNL